MRERISRWLLGRAEKHMPDFLRRRQLQMLMNLAAESFSVPAEKIRGGTAEEALAQYAAFTCRCMDAGSIDQDACSADEEKLYRDARRLGDKIRQTTGFTEHEDQNRLITLLYRNIGIEINITGDLRERQTGELIVPDCYFSRYYTPEQCRLMSFVDSGIVSGICGGGKLLFSHRITEGCGFCRACLEEDEVLLHGGKNHE